MPILLEVNVAGESSKFGYAPEKVLAELKEINALPKIEIHGLDDDCAVDEEPEKVRPIFSSTARAEKPSVNKFSARRCRNLSMGMSGDFEMAIEEGATLVRIGTALFGARQSFKKQIQIKNFTRSRTKETKKNKSSRY